MHTMTIRAFGLALLLSAPVLTWAQAPDAETARLEVTALCQAMPYQCPKGAAQTTLEDLRAIDARTMSGATPPDPLQSICPMLITTARVIRDKERWNVPLTPEDRSEWQTWIRDCRPWHAGINARIDKPATQPISHSTIECTTTSDSGRYRYSSTLTSTCTTY